MQDQFTGQAGSFIVDPDAGVRIPAEDYSAYLAYKAQTSYGYPEFLEDREAKRLLQAELDVLQAQADPAQDLAQSAKKPKKPEVNESTEATEEVQS